MNNYLKKPPASCILLIYKIVEKISPKLFERYIVPLRIYQIDKRNRPLIDKYINNLVSNPTFPLFVKLEIETINRCNHICTFCPVNKLDDTRPFKLMEQGLFLSIIRQLKEIEYSGSINLFSNNEPLLDDRIYEFCRITREALPNAFLSIYTNGILLTIEKFLKLIKYLDQLIIDNYNDKLTLLTPVRKVYDYWGFNKRENN
jgi:sulfatase maturation enzyme AslB (radical SAM superfamily)